jgi:hypothetical protein
MKLSKKGIAVLEALIIEIEGLNSESIRKGLIDQTTVLFDSPLCANYHNDIKLSLLSWMGCITTSKSLQETIEIFSETQSKLIKGCLKDIILTFRQLANKENIPLEAVISNMVDFINNRLDIESLLSSPGLKSDVAKLYPSVKCRLLIKISDILEKFFIDCEDASKIFVDVPTGNQTLINVDRLIQFVNGNRSRRALFKQAFERDLELYEKSSLLTGVIFKKQHELDNILRVYNSALRNLSVSVLDLSNQFLSLWIDLSDRMVTISNSFSNQSDSPIRVVVEPFRESINYIRGVNTGTVERQIQYGLTIVHRVATSELQPVTATIRALPARTLIIMFSEFLRPALAALFDLHAQSLSDQLQNSFMHQKRREEKHSALSEIIHASIRKELTPDNYYKASATKSLLFSSSWSSQTQSLFIKAKIQLKEQMWDTSSTMDRLHTDPPTGFYLRSDVVQKKLVKKYKSFLTIGSVPKPEYPDEADIAVRTGLTSEQQKSFDKEKSLGFLVKANMDGNLHPKHFKEIEQSFPKRNDCFWLRNSEVKAIIEEVKQDLCESMWIYAGGEGDVKKEELNKLFESKRSSSVSWMKL